MRRPRGRPSARCWRGQQRELAAGWDPEQSLLQQLWPELGLSCPRCKHGAGTVAPGASHDKRAPAAGPGMSLAQTLAAAAASAQDEERSRHLRAALAVTGLGRPAAPGRTAPGAPQQRAPGARGQGLGHQSAARGAQSAVRGAQSAVRGARPARTRARTMQLGPECIARKLGACASAPDERAQALCRRHHHQSARLLAHRPADPQAQLQSSRARHLHRGQTKAGRVRVHGCGLRAPPQQKPGGSAGPAPQPWRVAARPGPGRAWISCPSGCRCGPSSLKTRTMLAAHC